MIEEVLNAKILKTQIPKPKYQKNPNDRNSKFQTCFGHLIIEI